MISCRSPSLIPAPRLFSRSLQQPQSILKPRAAPPDLWSSGPRAGGSRGSTEGYICCKDQQLAILFLRQQLPAPSSGALTASTTSCCPSGGSLGLEGGHGSSTGVAWMLRGALSPSPARTHRSEQLSAPEVSAADLKCTLIARVSAQPARTPAHLDNAFSLISPISLLSLPAFLLTFWINVNRLQQGAAAGARGMLGARGELGCSSGAPGAPWGLGADPRGLPQFGALPPSAPPPH